MNTARTMTSGDIFDSQRTQPLRLWHRAIDRACVKSPTLRVVIPHPSYYPSAIDVHNQGGGQAGFVNRSKHWEVDK